MLNLSVTQSVFALRPGSGIDDPRGSVRTGLEEILGRSQLAAGVEERESRVRLNASPRI